MHKLALVLGLLICCGNAAAAAVRMQLIHTDAGRGLTRSELLQRMALRSKARAARLLSGAASAPVTPGQLDGAVPDTEFLAHFAIGTPPQPVQLTLDTGSDLTWTQCLPCISCFDQALPYFDPSLSSTFAELPCGSSACQNLPISSCATESSSAACGYAYSYGDRSVTIGGLDADTFTFAGAAVPGLLAFGCGRNNSGIFKSNETGIAGFGRGTLSLPSQLKVDNFSYCFTDITGSTPSPVLLGLPADLFSSASGDVQTIPLIQNPAQPSLYYLSLKGITVGSSSLPIPESTFALAEDGTGGTIIDSGTGITTLPKDVYNLVRDAFVDQVSLPVLNSASSGRLCFTVPPGGEPDVPKLIFNFEGATLDLPRENYMFEVEAAGGSSAICLAIDTRDAVDAEDGPASIIGNYQQQNMHVLYDLANNELSFVPAQCDGI